MNIKYIPYPVKKAPKNKWFLKVSFMSGDADAYDTEEYEFDSEAEFKEIYELFNKCFKFKQKYHNLMIDLWKREESKQEHIKEFNGAREKYAKYGYSPEKLEEYVNGANKCKADLIKFFGDFDRIHDMFEVLREKYEKEIEIPGDVTTDHQYRASLNQIEDMYCYDGNGVKFKIVIE